MKTIEERDELGNISIDKNLEGDSEVVSENNIAILHCTSEYPAPLDSINLKAMVTLKKQFNCEVGYSDHSEGKDISIAAVAMGATIIEKHASLDTCKD